MLNSFTVQVYDKETNSSIQDLTVLLIQYWLNEMGNYDAYILTNTVLIIENLVLCPSMWQLLKGSPIINTLLSCSKSTAASEDTKSKIIKIISTLTRDAGPKRPPSELRLLETGKQSYVDLNETISPYVSYSTKKKDKIIHQNASHKHFDFSRRKSNQIKEDTKDKLVDLKKKRIYFENSSEFDPYNFYNDKEKNNVRSLKSRGERLKANNSERFSFNLFNTIDTSKTENQITYHGSGSK